MRFPKKKARRAVRLAQHEKGLAELFSKRRPFKVDLRHLMENVRDHYTFSLEKAVSVENMDNCIDENYDEIRFKVETDIFEIEMVGSGMDSHTFFEIMPTLAGTTKGAKPGLGHYGWGMKVGMFVSDDMVIENKKGDFHAAQRWWLEKDGPWFEPVATTRELTQNTVVITHKLNKEYSKKLTLPLVKKTLQEFYPTLLDGVPTLGRKIKVLLNGEGVEPPPPPEVKEKQALWVDVDGQRATGKAFFTEDELPENLQGIAILVCGRLISRDYFGVHGTEDNKLTGYLHADMLFNDIAGDKTSIRRTSEKWRTLSKGIGKQLGEFMRKVGVLEEKSLDREDMAFVNRQLAKVLVDFPELNPMKFEIRKNVLIEKIAGDTPIVLEEGSQPTEGTGVGPGESSDVPTKPGEEKRKAPVEGKGGKKGTRKRRTIKSGPEIRELSQPNSREEAWFSEGEGNVYINRSTASFKKSERWGIKTKRYHVLRCAFDALLEWAVKNEIIKLKDYFEIRTELFQKWGDLR